MCCLFDWCNVDDEGFWRKRSVLVEIVSYILGLDGDCESGNRKYCNGNFELG